MRLTTILFLLVLVHSLTGYSQAQTLSKGKHDDYFELLESYSQRTLPGQRRSKPVTATHFIIIWKAATAPGVFFWSNDTPAHSLLCHVAKAYKMTGTISNSINSLGYTSESIAISKIHRGDTLILTPVPNERSILPPGIPKNIPDALLFTTSDNIWRHFPVKNIARKRDISMP